MSTHKNSPKKDQPSTYIVQDRQMKPELVRLTLQDRLITSAMGGVLPEQPDPTIFHNVLDIGCGPGGWLIDTALAYPTLSLVGIDISQHMIEYARAQATNNKVDERVEFLVMDVLRPLEFPAATFDLINIRCSVSYLRTWDWPRLLTELRRVTRPGGIIRLTEPEIMQQSNSAALTQLYEMLLCAFFRSGHLFEQASTGLNTQLEALLTRHGYRQVQTRMYALTYRGGTAEGQAYYETTKQGTLRPFLEKWGCTPPDYDEIYQQALDDMQKDSFQVTWNFLTAWGIIP